MKTKDVLWNMFTMSGDITYYLLYKQVSDTERTNGRKN